MAVDFNEISGRVADTIERPPLAPQGIYTMVVDKIPVVNDVKGKDGAVYKSVEYQCYALRGGPEVDVEELQKFGDPKGIRVRLSFMYQIEPEDANRIAQTQFREKTFLADHLGLPGDKSLKELRNQAAGQQFLGTLGYRADTNNPEVMYHDLKGTAPLA